MMIQPISYYDAKRNKGQRLGHEAPRETNGRKSRKAIAPVHMVYFIRVDGNPLLKVGRSLNIRERIKTYEQSSGRIARCHAQLVTANLADCISLENHAIDYLAARYARTRREWFAVPDDELPGLVADIVATAPVRINGQNGAPGVIDPMLPSLAEEAARVAKSVARAHDAKRGRQRI